MVDITIIIGRSTSCRYGNRSRFSISGPCWCCWCCRFVICTCMLYAVFFNPTFPLIWFCHYLIWSFSYFVYFYIDIGFTLRWRTLDWIGQPVNKISQKSVVLGDRTTSWNLESVPACPPARITADNSPVLMHVTVTVCCRNSIGSSIGIENNRFFGTEWFDWYLWEISPFLDGKYCFC